MQSKRLPIQRAFAAAFPHTLPILAGFLFLGIAYGIYAGAAGFAPIYPILMSLFIFAGSMEFVAVGLLLQSFNPLNALALTLMINARHLFYGISMLEKYRVPGAKRYYLIFGMCDESFSINCATTAPVGVDSGWFMFFVTLLNHLYWVAGATIGSLFGTLVHFNTAGLDFVMTALFVVIFLEQWLKEERHTNSLVGLGASLLCLLVFGPDHFIVASMLLILAILGLTKRAKKEEC